MLSVVRNPDIQMLEDNYLGPGVSIPYGQNPELPTIIFCFCKAFIKDVRVGKRLLK